MDKNEAKRFSDILLAHSEGKIIQRSKGNGVWDDLKELWITDLKSIDFILRIKPEPKLVPFTFEDNLLFRDKWFKKKGGTYLFTITKIMNSGVLISVDYWTSHSVSFGELLEQFEFEDGSPFGKYINE